MKGSRTCTSRLPYQNYSYSFQVILLCLLKYMRKNKRNRVFYRLMNVLKGRGRVKPISLYLITQFLCFLLNLMMKMYLSFVHYCMWHQLLKKIRKKEKKILLDLVHFNIKTCWLIIKGGSTANVASKKMMDTLNLKQRDRSRPYI